MAVDVELIDEAESWKIFDDAAQRELSMSGADFVRRWDSGLFKDELDTAVMRVAMLRPRGR